jgi:hypothetical protein
MHDSKRLSTLCCEKSCCLYADHISVIWEQFQKDERGFVTQYFARAAMSERVRRVAYIFWGPCTHIVSRFSSRGPDFVDNNRNPADVLERNILFPGHQIWAAWSSLSALNPILPGKQVNNLQLLPELKVLLSVFTLTIWW